MENCVYCLKECKNKNSRVNHQRFCKLNPERKESPFKAWKSKNKTPWNKGLTSSDAPQLACSEKTKRHLSKVCTGKGLTPETEQVRVNKIRNHINARYKAGWESSAGRCKKYDYDSPIAGKIKVDGTWELAVAKYFDKAGLMWERNKTRFNYIRPDGKNATYQPDFFIHEWNTYLEVKGYETDLDRCKWKQFCEPLLIWKRSDIKRIILESKSIRD